MSHKNSPIPPKYINLMRWDSGSYKGPNLENISKLTHPWGFIFYVVIFCKLCVR